MVLLVQRVPLWNLLPGWNVANTKGNTTQPLRRREGNHATRISPDLSRNRKLGYRDPLRRLLGTSAPYWWHYLFLRMKLEPSNFQYVHSRCVMCSVAKDDRSKSPYCPGR